MKTKKTSNLTSIVIIVLVAILALRLLVSILNNNFSVFDLLYGLLVVALVAGVVWGVQKFMNKRG